MSVASGTSSEEGRTRSSNSVIYPSSPKHGGKRPTMAAWAFNVRVKQRLHEANRIVSGSHAPYRQRIGRASRCLTHLSENDFPTELRNDVLILFKIFDYVKHSAYVEYQDFSKIPTKLQKIWIESLLRVHEMLLLAIGRYCGVECEDVCDIHEDQRRCVAKTWRCVIKVNKDNTAIVNP